MLFTREFTVVLTTFFALFYPFVSFHGKGRGWPSGRRDEKLSHFPRLDCCPFRSPALPNFMPSTILELVFFPAGRSSIKIFSGAVGSSPGIHFKAFLKSLLSLEREKRRRLLFNIFRICFLLDLVLTTHACVFLSKL